VDSNFCFFECLLYGDYINGVIDVALNLTSDDVDLLASDGYGTSVAADSHSVANIAISSTNEILANNETLREAICIGTDAAVIASRAYGSLGSTADSSLSSTQPYYVGGYGYTYDLERAKELVESTGLSSEELTFTLVASSQNACQVIAESFQYYMEQIGITINVEIYDQATCQQLWMESGNTDFLINSFYMPTASNEAANALEWMLGTVYVDFGYAGEISDLLIDAKSTLDTEERAELYAQVQQVVYESYVMVPIAEWSTAYVYGENVAECDISITASPNLRYVTMK
ncbi:MAG: ABC transporter substrate-binding protein, partial [Oscillospiraceae bacterium]|nr:ABC transporter substrate-binding protein [Oscillospiraceae bacterium]